MFGYSHSGAHWTQDKPVFAELPSPGQEKAHDFNQIRPQAFGRPVFQRIENMLFGKAETHPAQEVTEADVYEDNSGTFVVVNVGNKLIVASDTRHSAEYNINSRYMTRVFRLGPFFLTTAGFYADSFEVYTIMLYEIKRYETHRKITLKAAAHLLHNVLYSKRFFPYYTHPCISGVEDGVAGVYSFDSIGNYELVKCRCEGSGSKMIQPLLDSWVSGKNFRGFQELELSAVVNLVKKAFDSAAERDVRTKDFLEMYVVDGDDVHFEVVQLRKD